jgi:hypothetical protein
VGRQQHLVRRDHRSTLLDRLADPFARGRNAADHFDNDVRRSRQYFVEVVSPDNRVRHPISALAIHPAIEHVRQPQSSGQFGTLDENPRNRGTNSAEPEKRNLERARDSGLSALGSRLWTLGSRLWAVGSRHCLYSLQVADTLD